MWQGLQQNSYTHKIPSWKLGRMLTTPLPFLIRSSMTKIWTPDSEMKSQMLCWWSQPRTYYNYGAQRCQNRSIHSSSLTQSFFFWKTVSWDPSWHWFLDLTPEAKATMKNKQQGLYQTKSFLCSKGNLQSSTRWKDNILKRRKYLQTT